MKCTICGKKLSFFFSYGPLFGPKLCWRCMMLQEEREITAYAVRESARIFALIEKYDIKESLNAESIPDKDAIIESDSIKDSLVDVPGSTSDVESLDKKPQEVV